MSETVFGAQCGARGSSGTALYVVDFGVMTLSAGGPVPQKGTGVLWRITREGGR